MPSKKNTKDRASGRRRGRPAHSPRRGRKRAAHRRREEARASVEDRRTARALVEAPGVVLDDRVIEAKGWRHDPELGVMVTVNDESGRQHAWSGWEVPLDDLAVSDTPPAWLADDWDVVDGRFSDELTGDELAKGVVRS